MEGAAAELAAQRELLGSRDLGERAMEPDRR